MFIIFEALKLGDQIPELKLNLMKFWVHVLDLPFGWATDVGEVPGKSLSLVKGVILEGNSLKLCVVWYMTKPFRRSILTMKNGVPLTLR